MKTTTTKKLSPKRALETKLNDALYAAAKKAGMVEELYKMQAETVVSHDYQTGNVFAYLVWEEEQREDESFVFNRAVWDRANKWFAAYCTQQGIETR